LNAKKTHDFDAVSFAQKMEQLGVGEIIIQSVDHDGTMQGYNDALTKKIIESVSIPVVCLGGAGTKEDLKAIYQSCSPNGLAAGSMFVYQGTQKGVLINYLNKEEKEKIYEQ
jgi:cyclase